MSGYEHRKFYFIRNNLCNLFTCSIHISDVVNFKSETSYFGLKKGNAFRAYLDCPENTFTFSIRSNSSDLQCCVSMFIGLETLLYSNSVNKGEYSIFLKIYCYDVIKLTSEDQCFQTLKQHANDTLFLVCRILNCPDNCSEQLYRDTTTDTLRYLQTLGAALKNTSESFLNEKVLLKVGEESETVSKALLCARSPVFTKMFQSDMKEQEKNVVNITDIKMPVIKTLVYYLYTGQIDTSGIEFTCDLYYAADKYDITELRQSCVDVLLQYISTENVFRLLKFAISFNIECLKSTAMAFMLSDIGNVVSKDEWKNLINDDPKIAIEFSNFIDSVKISRAKK